MGGVPANRYGPSPPPSPCGAPRAARASPVAAAARCRTAGPCAREETLPQPETAATSASAQPTSFRTPVGRRDQPTGSLAEGSAAVIGKAGHERGGLRRDDHGTA